MDKSLNPNTKKSILPIIGFSALGLLALVAGGVMYRNYRKTGNLFMSKPRELTAQEKLEMFQRKIAPIVVNIKKGAALRGVGAYPPCDKIPTLTDQQLSKYSGMPITDFINKPLSAKLILKRFQARAIIAAKSGCQKEYQQWLDEQAGQ